MQIDIVSSASPNGAPTTESTDVSSPAPDQGPGSFAALLNAAADQPTESTPAEEDEEESVDESKTVPVFVPFVPVILPQDMTEGQDSPANGIEAVGDVDAAIETAVANSPGVSSFAGPGAPPSVDADFTQPDPPFTQPGPLFTQPEPPFTQPGPPIGVEAPGPVDGVPVEFPVGTYQPGTDIQTAAPSVSKESTSNEPAQPNHGKPPASVPNAPAAVDDSAIATSAEAVATNASSQAAQNESVVRTRATEAPSEPASNPKGVAARFARALERAAEPAAVQRAADAPGEDGQSFNQRGNGQPSLGEWLREELPQVAPGRLQTNTPSFSVVTALQNNSPAAAVFAAPGGALTPSGSAPADGDVTLQIVQSLRLQFRDGIGEAVLKLKPEHLGSVSISLRIENGGIKASVQAEVPAVRLWLESQQDTLRNALADHGLRLDRFDVEPDGQRQASSEDADDERSPRKRQSRKPLQSEQPVFEVVV